MNKVWLVKYSPLDLAKCDFFRLFTRWEDLLAAINLPPAERHPAWNEPFEIWALDFEEGIMQEISVEVLTLATTL